MSSISILYVEDNDDLREAMALLLEGEGRKIVACASGEEALLHWGDHGFDVLISDVSLPGMSGVTLAQRLLARRPCQRVLMCSGFGAQQGAGVSGANVRWITKPFDMADLEALLDDLLAADTVLDDGRAVQGVR